eukprot:3732119-Pyramimonas_sp.AAC.2
MELLSRARRRCLCLGIKSRLYRFGELWNVGSVVRTTSFCYRKYCSTYGSQTTCSARSIQ